MSEQKFNKVLSIIRDRYGRSGFIPLHTPVFKGREKEFVVDTIDSTYVSSVGSYVDKFEEKIAAIAGTRYAVATVNGTSALHTALIIENVEPNDEIIMQDLTFVATANAIRYMNASPVFLDIDLDTLGLSPNGLEAFLEEVGEIRDDGYCWNKQTGARIKACVPMHSLGHPCRIDKVVEICNQWNITVIEDAAESLGSYYQGRHTGSFGKLGIFSFNGNKIVTCGGGGAVVTDDKQLAQKAKHITTQAKKSHDWEYLHDLVGYNYRMPNLNAALACAQLEQLDHFIRDKRRTASYYEEAFSKMGIKFQKEPGEARSNYWLNAIFFENIRERDQFLKYSNSCDVMTRPVWTLMHKLPAFDKFKVFEINNALKVEEHLVNIPSSVTR